MSTPRPLIGLPLFTVARLGAAACTFLAPKVRAEDVQECADMGHTPLAALRAGMEGGTARAVLDQAGDIWGAYGINGDVIWSLWADLSPAQARFVVKNTKAALMKLGLSEHNLFHRPHNYVSSANRKAIRWLRRSKCFDLDVEHPIRFKGTDYYTLTVKADLRNV